MKKNKKINTSSFWRPWIQSPNFLKTLFVYLAFSIIFIFVLILVWKQYTGTGPREGVAFLPTQQAQLAPGDLKSLSEYLGILETQQIQQSQENLRKVTALVLIRAVLDGIIPLEAFKNFLQKTQGPWGKAILATLDPIKEGKTYFQLEALLILSPPLPVSTWQHIKSTLKSFIHIRKLDEKNEVNKGLLKNIQKALRMHDIQKAIEIYEKLPSEEKAQLSSWKKLAEERLLLELSTQKLLLELADS